MKFLVIGLGSMGKRRIRCLRYLGEKDITGFDLRKDRCEEASSKYGINAYTDFEEALLEKPDVFIISVPSNLHHKYAVEAIKRKINFFTESNFLPEGIDNLIETEKKGEIICVPSFTMPHHPMVKIMKSFVEGSLDKIYSFTYHLGAYLPLWHPWEDYRQVYYSKKETSGSTEMIAFELTWIVWLFGDIKQVCGFKSKRSSLEIDFDDTYQILLEFKNGILGHLIIDIVSNPSGRNMKIIAERGTLLWNSEEEMIKFFNNEKKIWEQIKGDIGFQQQEYTVHIHEEMYIEEMDDFLKALRGEKRYPYTFTAEKKIINLLGTIEKSISEKRVMEVNNENK